MNVVVTGGAGFIGSHIAERLLLAGHRTLVVDNLATGRRGNVPPGAEFHELDLLDAGLLPLLARFEPECVVHQAALPDVARSVANPTEDARVNLLGSLAVFEGARRSGARKVVFASSAALYGHPHALPIGEDHPPAPLSPYGLAKWAAERYLVLFRELYGLQFTALRYANVYGPRQLPEGEGAVIATFAGAAARGEAVVVHGDGEQTRDFVAVADVVEANLAALSAGDAEIVNIGGGRAISVNALCEALEAASGERLRRRTGPSRPADIRHSVLNSDRARRVLGWQPRTELAAGLAEVLAWHAARAQR